MIPLRRRLDDARHRLGLSWEVMERDYVLSWLLAGMSRVASLRDTMVFKGGTALKKCYFGDYRFSEDLDFSATAKAPRGVALEEAWQAACAAAVRLADPYAPLDIRCERYTEREPHPTGQEAFVMRARLPWQTAALTRILVEVTVDEPMLTPPRRRRVLHDYGEPLQARVLVYSPAEIVAEKLRAILQHEQRLAERGWSRSRARDYYDLWRILGEYGDQIPRTGFAQLLRKKCAVRQVTFRSPAAFFPRAVLSAVADSWDQGLGVLVPQLPPFDVVLRDLRPQVVALLSAGR